MKTITLISIIIIIVYIMYYHGSPTLDVNIDENFIFINDKNNNKK